MSLLLALSLTAAGGAAGCGSGDPTAAGGESGGAGSGGASSSGATGSGGSLVLDTGGASDEGGAPTGSGGSSITNLELGVRAERTEIEANGSPEWVQVTAEYEDGSKPNRVAWSVDDTRVGSINDHGEFRAHGNVAGTVLVTATVGSQTASVELTVTVSMLDGPDSVPESAREELLLGGEGGASGVGPDEKLRVLYPYDETVFPRGLAAPLVQLDSSGADFSYVKLTAGAFTYEAFAEASDPLRVALPEEAWRGVTLSAGPSDWVELEVTTSKDGAVTGPVGTRWLIAPGSLKGLIYYNTYRSPLAGNNGAVMRIRPGEGATVLQSGCTVCHSVSARGNVMVAGVQWQNPDPAVSRAFNLSSNGNAQLRDEDADGRVYAFGGLTPDGAFMLSNGVPSSGAKPRGLGGNLKSRLVETATGEMVAATGLGVEFALTPNFSPDGKRVAFNDHDASANGHVLSMLSFDGSASPPAFSDHTPLVQDEDKVVAWPSFLPDGEAVVYHAGDSFDTAGYKGGARYADLELVEVATKQVKKLAKLNGWDEDGAFYLPHGEDEEAHLNYEPSVLPVPVGGYYWVLFTSRRAYGNTIAPGGTVPRGDDIFGIPQAGEEESPSPRKKIWVAAIDLAHDDKADPSHPAFYLPGQELEAGNMRAFAALEPCKKKGSGCESAAECCDGFCRETSRDADGTPILECVPPPENSCSNEDESCATAGDCCNSKYQCINHRCAVPTPPPPPVE